MEWIALLIPLAVVGFFYVYFKNKITWWEPTLPIIASILIILCLKGCGESALTTDTEYLNSYVVQVERDERWEEDIECSYDCNCYESCDSDGENCTEICSTCYYDCPEWHDECYRAVMNIGESRSLNKSEYYYYVKLFNTGEKFKDLHRSNYYNGHDGDRYIVQWDGSDATLQYFVSKQTYENKVQASDDVFNFPDVDTNDVKLYKLKEYPGFYESYGLTKQNHLLGITNPRAEKKLRILNAKLGKKKEVKAFILVWPGGNQQSGNMQEWYWKGGNKNEFIVCLGTEKNNPKKVNWVKVFSWSESHEMKIEVREWVNEHSDNFDIEKFIDYLYVELDTKFVRKKFSDFDYLEIEIPTGWLIAIYIVVFIFSVLLCIFAILNEFDPADTRDNKHFSRKKNIYNRFGRYNRFR